MVTPGLLAFPRQDVIAGVVVFLVAVPLCLGIAIASGVPPVAGLVAGVVGGLVVPLLSRSPLSVTGPAAGLASIVVYELNRLGGLSAFLAAVVIAGFVQIGLGLLRTGRFSALVPSAAIKGMLAAIGISIVLKQLPVAFGVAGAVGDIPSQLSFGPTLVALISLVILVAWPKSPLRRLTFLPASLVVVVLATVLAWLFQGGPLELTSSQFVGIPGGGVAGLWAALTHPEPSAFLRVDVWVAGVTIAIVGSIETLLSVQAVDRLDPLRRRSPPDRELVAQGVANALSGLLGGLPVTAVIVRSSANVAAGARGRLSAFVHGVLLLLAVVFGASLLNHVPLACLAAILIVVGFNLAKPSLFAQQGRLGRDQLVPFIATIAAVLALDLLKGVVVGVVIAVVFALHQNNAAAIKRSVDDDGTLRLRFRRDATFLTRPQLLAELDSLSAGSKVVVDTGGAYVDLDVKETLAWFVDDAASRQILARIEGPEPAASGGA